MVKNAKI